MIKKLKYLSVLLLLLLFAFDTPAEGVKDGKKNLRKTSGSPTRTYMNINNITTHFLNDLQSDNDQDGNSGFVYPKGTGKAAFFQTGFVFGGKIDGEIRVGGATFQSGMLGGRILEDGTPEDPEAPHVRIYRVRRDYKTGSMSAEVRMGEGSESVVKAQYETDWNEWPALDGAPYTDVDSSGSYDPTIDIPGFPGADQTIWFVANDANNEQSESFYGSSSMMAEVQVTIWGYALPAPLGNMIFRKYKIINKNDRPYEDFYVSVWSDPDLGNASDDYAGCDTVLSLGYIYNSVTGDAVYSSGAPAGGFDYFQGPIVDGEPTDTAIFNNKYVFGKKNLGMSAFYYFINSNAIYADPTFGVYDEGALRFYNLLEGKIATTGEYFPIPPSVGGGVTKFPLSGDPVAGTGYTDGILFNPGDRRIGMVSGPFTMAPSDTQEVVVAQIIAGGSGFTNLQSLALLKSYSEIAQDAYDKFFQLPAAPRLPDVRVTELEREVVLNWGWNQEQVAETESHNLEHFTFQGYNVYQLPSANSTKENAVRIATYDLAGDEVKFILGPEVDPNSGVTLDAVQQFGNDTGLKREISLTTDYIEGGPLVNGKRYYYAVTAYAYNPDSISLATNLENSFNVLTVTPHFPNPGTVYGGNYGDTLVVAHEGVSDGQVIAIVKDPSQLTGHTYNVTFYPDSVYDADHDEYVHNTYWTLTDVTTSQVKLTGQLNQTGDEEYLNVDGLLVKVVGPPSGMKDYEVTGTRFWSWAGGNWGSEGFNGAIGYADANWFIPSSVKAADLSSVSIRFTATDTLGNMLDPNNANASFGYRYLRAAAAPPAKPEFAPFIVNPTASFAFQDYTKSVPFSAWDMFTDPPTRLMVGYTENNVAGGLVDGKYFPPDTDGDNTGVAGPREWFFIFDVPYSETPDPVLQQNVISSEMPIMWFGTVTRRATEYADGSELLIVANRINVPGEVFSFNAPLTTYSSETAKADVEMINVFPNPYYGASSEELNKYQKFVTISHLPVKATVRIFNLAGQLVRTYQKNSPEQFLRWDLKNERNLPVASGLFIIHVDMPELGKTKVLKAAIIQEQQILDRF